MNTPAARATTGGEPVSGNERATRPHNRPTQSVNHPLSGAASRTQLNPCAPPAGVWCTSHAPPLPLITESTQEPATHGRTAQQYITLRSQTADRETAKI